MRFILILTLTSTLSFAHAVRAEECKKTKNIDALLNCILQKHPDLKIAELDVNVAKEEIRKAEQRPNLELQWQGTESEFGSGLTNELNLQHTIELGGKQSARVGFAKSDFELRKIDSEAIFNQVKINLIIQLYRLRQINHEIEVISENKQTFEKMISQYRRIGKMNPEQEISLNVFRMSAEEVKLKLGALENEKDQILSEFRLITNEDLTPAENQLPKLIHTWPNLERGNFKGPIIKQAEAEVKKAEKAYQVEKAESWPNLSLGPRIVDIPGPQGGTFIGAAANLPLPIINLNRGGRASALANKKRQEYRNELIKRRILTESERLIKAYDRSSKAYTSARKSSNFHAKHSELHKMINRGVVSPTIVIELHQQIIAFYESLHSQELEAVKARWAYYSLLGNVANQKINDFSGVK